MFPFSNPKQRSALLDFTLVPLGHIIPNIPPISNLQLTIYKKSAPIREIRSFFFSFASLAFTFFTIPFPSFNIFMAKKLYSYILVSLHSCILGNRHFAISTKMRRFARSVEGQILSPQGSSGILPESVAPTIEKVNTERKAR